MRLAGRRWDERDTIKQLLNGLHTKDFNNFIHTFAAKHGRAETDTNTIIKQLLVEYWLGDRRAF